ncbi:MAG: bifunctional pantoate--beta-alanine ligase/(d)CMP kinase, partial [Synechococcales bacterium]|nr:bifunctional pantoate--beta-alanine ligase/(d)CMP kinase [Synechococcales bacterium]
FYGTPKNPDAHTVTQVLPPQLMRSPLCGRTRLGHFEGVATVVTKLLNLVRPNRAYFGRKDAQQLAILQQLVRDLNLGVEIVPCPIVREASGLALSSRNQYLNVGERQAAAVIYRSLQRAEALFRTGVLNSRDLITAVFAELASEPLVQPEYVELVHPQTLVPLETITEAGLLAIAAQVGSTRLIDNMILRTRRPIIAIDGPAGAGKSTVARQVAQQLDLLYLDTGAMYRAITWLMLHTGTDLQDEPAVAELVSQSQIRLTAVPTDGTASFPMPCQVWINGQDVTQVIRTEAVTSNVSAIAAQPSVRQALVQQQQHYGRNGGIVIDGRDIGTHVFPDAELKLFLTASVHERARRRQQDLKNQGQAVQSLEQIEQAIHRRDYQDSTRAIAPLRKAPDAIEIQTDALSADEVVAQIVALYQQMMGG